jgi:hypothetical protein
LALVAESADMNWAALGGFAGLVTFVFAIWDRLVRDRPLAWIVAERIGSQAHPYLRIRNPAQVDILIRNILSTPDYSVGESETLMGAVRASVGDAVLAVLAAGETRNFPIFHSQKPRQKGIMFTVSWRRASSSWLPQIPKRTRISVADLTRIVAACERAATSS